MMSSREMGSFFYHQAMENVHGDLTDIVRATNNGGGGGGSCDGCSVSVNFPLLADMSSNFEESNITASASSAKFSPKPVPLASPARVTGVKRRKGQAKRVICIPAPPIAGDQESSKTGGGGGGGGSGGVVVPSDLWAWRKYGQKPIKGSPYPRGYYRCSSSKGCSARKQVERSRSDPNMLVITYTSEHNHPWPTQRNSLAGSTRSQTSKAHNTTAISVSGNVPPVARNQTPPPATSTSRPEPDMMLKEEIPNFDQIFDHSFQPIMLESKDIDLFEDLGGLDPDPMSFFLSSEEEGKNTAVLDPLSLSFFDWDGN